MSTISDWPRRRAYVEPTDLAGRSRWVGAAQPMHLQLCQAIADVLGGAESAINLSKRAHAQLQKARADHPWVEKGSTALLRRHLGAVEWWNFAGRLLNAALAGHFRRLGMEASFDQAQVVFPANSDFRAIRSATQQLVSDAATISAVPLAQHVMPELKFSACVPDYLLTQMGSWPYLVKWRARESHRGKWRDLPASPAAHSTPIRPSLAMRGPLHRGRVHAFDTY